MAQQLVTDQGDKTAILITDISAADEEEIFVQYLGNETARLHWVFYDNVCQERSNFAEPVTPLEVVNITNIPDGVDRKLVVFVDSLDGTTLLDQPLIGIKYLNNRIATHNLAGVIAPNTNQSENITDAGVIRFNGDEYGFLPQDFDYLPFLNTRTNFSNNITNLLYLNSFNLTAVVNTTHINDEEEQFGSAPFLGIDCTSFVNLDTEGIGFGNIGGTGIVQGIPPGAGIVGGAGVLRSQQVGATLFGEAYLIDNNPTLENESNAAANLFFREQGAAASLAHIPLFSLPPQGLFTGFNDNYQNPFVGSAVASVGVQRPVSDNSGTGVNETVFNRDTIFAVYNNGPAREVKARFDFLDQSGEVSTCQHQDINISMTQRDVEYFRVSQFTGSNLLPGDAPIIGALTVWDPQTGETLLGYRWDAIIETASECNDFIDNDGDGFFDFGDDTECSSFQDDDEGTAGDQARTDEIYSVDTMEQMLTLNVEMENNVATFEAAEHFTTLVPTIPVDPFGTIPDYNIIVVNWDALDDDDAASDRLNFQVADQDENLQSLDLPSACITVLDRSSFGNLADGSQFGTDPDIISITGEFNTPNRGLAAFLYYNENGINPVESVPSSLSNWQERSGSSGLAFTNTHHDGEIFTDIVVLPGALPGPGGTFTVDVGITTSAALAAESVTATWYAATTAGNVKTKGPVICSQTESITASAGDAFAIVVDDCAIDPLSVDAILQVQSATLGTAELFVPQGP